MWASRTGEFCFIRIRLTVLVDVVTPRLVNSAETKEEETNGSLVTILCIIRRALGVEIYWRPGLVNVDSLEFV